MTESVGTWAVGLGYEQDTPGTYIYLVETGEVVLSGYEEPSEDDARRIVASVNALSHLSVKEIEAMIGDLPRD